MTVAPPLVTGVAQIGIVVADVAEAVDRYRHLLGIDEWYVTHVDSEDGDGPFSMRDGETDLKVKIASAHLGGVELELIEPQDDTSIYAEFLRTRGPGVHHVMFDAPDDAQLIARLSDVNFDVLIEGELQESRFHVFDTEHDLGLAIEIATGDAPQPDEVI
jgi:catechol 2,3-dioxygenase-like lactoylglutathione lyase family enzyme